ncbi:putative het-s domain containing protein [Botrytis fragariae]|uniref:Putative het-s domain containing protein n=1 Tax=Botrytis fragariae TaxID=1964551 RepID=A0A8H6AVS9_9HELO|nr:putative het-s domain containing protein [Botrytis fragariae]KAF5874385.1 putative het-s domain containing protein [Botrytis fragariae]
MDQYFTNPMPLQRRLTKIYTDTKNIYDFIKEPVRNVEDHELQSLHRKLRIQQSRLVSWGLEWSDPSQSPDIDESVSKAGLSEIVGNVMSTIKEILAEAEPLWQSSKRLTSDERPSEKSEKSALIQWDKTRFEDLIRDLTMSIDTLYDLSKTRQSARTGLQTSEASSSKDDSSGFEERQFESTRMSAPQQIDPATLIWTGNQIIATRGTSRSISNNTLRQIVLMRRSGNSSDLRQAIDQPPDPIPVLVEYAPYDPIYSVTGITPSMTRFEKLFAGLSQAYYSSDRLLVGLLRLIGYYEDAEHSRFCLLFALPTNFGPMDIQSPTLQMPIISSLSELLISPAFEPNLEVKYRLAYNIANAVFDLHSKGIVHGNLLPSNVLFIEHPTPPRAFDLTQVNMRQSYLGSYDLFSDTATDSGPSFDSASMLYKHPLDPRSTKYTNLSQESKSLDLYSLAMILLEIGLWSSLSELFPRASQVPSNPTEVLKRLASRCGNIYVKAVKACLSAPEGELSRKARPDVMHQKVFWRVSKALNTCCSLDDVSDDDSERSDEPSLVPTPVKIEAPSSSIKGYRERRDAKIDITAPQEPEINWGEKPIREKSPQKATVEWPEKKSSGELTPIQGPFHVIFLSNYSVSAIEPIKSKPKLKTFPAIRISQEHINLWHKNIMPHVNHVLRSFYKKYPESVEISLESVGESSTKTKPTILVICTSVNKVRSILKKSLVYDKATYGLKVCRGKVVRARNGGVKRSMAHGDELEAKNTEHQARPKNGASMGAYINDHHLPPVSFGGLVTVDDKPYGMSVHHMLDDPSDNDDEEQVQPSKPILRSSARPQAHPQYLEMPDLTHSDTSYYSSGDEEYNYSFTDYSSSGSSFDSDSSPYASEDEDDSDGEFPTLEPGDIPPIPVSSSNVHNYPVTQPAIDDIDPNFYPDPETRDEDHLDSFLLGSVYTSSGIRRLAHENITHEIDWCLFEFEEDRLPDLSSSMSLITQPTGVVPLTDLPDLPVKCTARTSGTQTGRILPSMSILKIYGRKTPSMSWQVAGKIGVPGDSGAWVLERGDDISTGPGNNSGRIAGSVLAWSQRRNVGYICPMWISVLDMANLLNCENIGLPGVEIPIWSKVSARKERDTVSPILKKAFSFTSDRNIGGWDSEDEMHSLGHNKPQSGSYPVVIDDDLADDEDELSGVLGNVKHVGSDHEYKFADHDEYDDDDESYDEEEEREYWSRFKAASVSPERVKGKGADDEHEYRHELAGDEHQYRNEFANNEHQYRNEFANECDPNPQGIEYQHSHEKEVLISSEEEPELLATLGQPSRRGRGFGVRTFSGDKSLEIDMMVGGLKGLSIDGNTMPGKNTVFSMDGSAIGDFTVGGAGEFDVGGSGQRRETRSRGSGSAHSGTGSLGSLNGMVQGGGNRQRVGVRS